MTTISADSVVAADSIDEQKQVTGKPAVNRRHDLDALRAIAMLLGIVLHVALSFATIPWSVKDSHQSSAFDVMFAAIHGFRMPLFFLLSGFFTAMLWRRRGLVQLILHRLRRIALPLFIGCFTIIPSMWIVMTIVNSPPALSPTEGEIWTALSEGNVDRVKQGLEQQQIDVNATHPGSGATLLTSAAFFGHTELVEMLIDQGADVNARNADQGTALHTATFMGRADSAILLLEAGADPELLDATSNKPLDLLSTDFGTTSFIAAQYGAQLDEDELISERQRIAQALGADEALVAGGAEDLASALSALSGLFFYLPVFMHLWFLWFLCWLVAAFSIYSLIAKAVRIDKLPRALICSPLSLLWLLPLTMLPQLFMQTGVFGPDTSNGLLPIPSVLVYYAIFFFFGAIYWDMDDQAGKLGRWWFVSLPLAMFIVLPLGLDSVDGSLGLLPEIENVSQQLIVSSFLQSLYAWLMITGSIGCFRYFVPRESKTLRYVSDSSYWLYLVHLPLVLLAQWFVRDWNLPALAKFFLVTVALSAFLLLTYRYGVRYTFIGRILNGPRVRPGKAEQEATA